MKGNLRAIIGVLCTACLSAIYISFPYIGTISLMGIVLIILVASLLFAGIFCVAYRMAPAVLPKIRCPKIEALIYDTWKNRSFMIILWAILVICWLPTYLAFFPGIFGYDAPVQMQQFLGEKTWTAHHPILHTVFLGWVMECGKILFGNYNGGVALFCAIQGILVTESMAYGFLFMKTKRVPFPILVITFLGCACNPILQVLSFNMTKDILFGVSFFHFMLCCYKWLDKQSRNSKWDQILLIFWGVLSCLLRNQGKYIILVLMSICLIIYRTNRKFVLSLGIIFLSSQLFFSVSTDILGIEKSDEREMLSIPMQQMSFVCNLYMQQGDVNLTPEEFQKMTNLIEAQYLSLYRQDISDPIKSHFRTEVLKENWLEYARLYISVGLKNPGYYMMAIRNMIYPYWDMSLSKFQYLCVENTFPEISIKWGIEQESLFPAYKALITESILSSPQTKEVVNIWYLQPGICIWAITVLLGFAIVRDCKETLIVTLIQVLFLGTLLLGPVALFRYIYPLMIAMPWTITAICNLAQRKEDTYIRQK